MVPIDKPLPHHAAVQKHLCWDVACTCEVGHCLVTMAGRFGFLLPVWYILIHTLSLPKIAATNPPQC